jgi:hypothetical protein
MSFLEDLGNQVIYVLDFQKIARIQDLTGFKFLEDAYSSPYLQNFLIKAHR